ncbi:ABC transporter ATP-binding protein [Nocardioides sediminis]|uniref:ABC transporter ATP-binding protein n=1 Tax=Nocardioides sediminis TaxID=433648 RepID=UPI000D30FCEA|nr:ABC transporter ATP-binding protein [Nocardioides sediminis]
MLEIDELHVSYGKVRAVRGVSLAARPGRVTLVLGANGAGKTTTLRAVMGLQSVDSGRVRVDGTDITGKDTHKVVRAGVSLVPEGRRVFAPLTVEENLLLGGYSTSATDRADTLQKVYGMFPILSDRRDGAAGLLSGGEQQMLAFGRALMSRSKYVLMDEPSMGLAPSVVQTVLMTAREIADSGIGVLMVEQNAEAGLQVADEVVAISQGEVGFTGDVAAARADRAILRAFLGESALSN